MVGSERLELVKNFTYVGSTLVVVMESPTKIIESVLEEPPVHRQGWITCAG